MFCDNTAVSPSTCSLIMKKWICLCLCLIAVPAFANNWVRYAQNDDATRYYDKLRMVNMSGTAFIWDMQNLTNPATDSSGHSYRSVLYPTEFSCRKHLRRVLSARRMSGTMGEGSVVSEQAIVGTWVEVMPQTPDDELMKAVCNSQ
jgi:hypothetical protein